MVKGVRLTHLDVPSRTCHKWKRTKCCLRNQFAQNQPDAIKTHVNLDGFCAIHPYMLDAHNARSCRTVHSWPASENPKRTKIQQIETSLMQICEATVSSGHNISNPISSEEIALPLFSCPAAEAKQMSPSGSGINNPLDCGYCFASGGGLSSFNRTARSDRKKITWSPGLGPSHAKDK